MIYPSVIPLPLVQGATNDFPIEYTDDLGAPIDLTGVEAYMHVRETIDSPDILLALSTANGRIVINGPLGKITIIFEPVDTEGVEWRVAVYDLEFVWPSGRKDRFCQGTIILSPETTRG